MKHLLKNILFGWVIFSSYNEKEFLDKLNSLSYEKVIHSEIHFPSYCNTEYKILYYEYN